MLHNNVKLKKTCFRVQPPSRHFNKIKKKSRCFSYSSDNHHFYLIPCKKKGQTLMKHMNNNKIYLFTVWSEINLNMSCYTYRIWVLRCTHDDGVDLNRSYWSRYNGFFSQMHWKKPNYMNCIYTWFYPYFL